MSVIGEDTPISIGLAVLFVVGLFGLWWRVSSAISAVEKDLADFKIEAAKTFATATAISQSEERLTTALNQVASRMEKVAERVDGVATDLGKVTVELARLAEAMTSRRRSPRSAIGGD